MVLDSNSANEIEPLYELDVLVPLQGNMLIQNCHLREYETLLYLKELNLPRLLRELRMGLDKFDGSIHGIPL